MKSQSYRSVSARLLGLVAIGCAGLTLVGCGNSGNVSQTTTPAAFQPPIVRSPSKPAAPKAPAVDVNLEIAKKWQDADKAHTEESYLAFAKAFPQDPKAAKAKGLAGQLAWSHAQRAGTADAYRAFAGKYPTDPHSAQAATMAHGQDVSLAEAVRRGWVRSHVTGDGLQSVSLTIVRKVGQPLRVSIPAGTYFVSGGGSQNMVACEDSSADLTSSKSADLTVGAACANFYREQPDEHNTFSVQGSHPNPNLRKVLSVISSEHPEDLVSQLAIWSITDNPSRSEVDEHISISPSTDDYQQAAGILRKAGVSPSARRMFRGIH